jgi:hypothetical protein
MRIEIEIEIIVVVIASVFLARVSVYVKQTDPTTKAFVRVLSPFSTGLWRTILVTTLLLLLTQRAIFNIGVHYELQEETDCRFLDAWLYLFGIFCQQGKLRSISIFKGQYSS